MSLAEMIEKVGGEHIKVQNLHAAMKSAVYSGRKDETTISFVTKQPVDGSQVGFVLWIPRERLGALNEENP